MNTYPNGMLNGMASVQIAVRIDETLLAGVDALVADGGGSSRADVVRRGVEMLLHRHEQERIDRLIVDGYRQSPSTLNEDAAAEASLRAAIAEEPW